ncbi:MAG: ABC transporter permease [Lachnospiraceae bacterium]|nr:ABC transporter permease [Lachnospiraceae bacterium]
MFFHNLKYNFLYSLRARVPLFWTLVFPIALSTFMFMAFGKINETTEQFKAVPVGIVTVNDNAIFHQVLDEVSGEDGLLIPKEMTEDNALEALDDGDIDGIIYVDDKISLSINENGIEQTILSSFVDRYIQTQSTVMNILETDPAKIQTAAEKLTAGTPNYRELTVSDGNTDNLVNYFYAILAMSCLFASFIGISSTLNLQANLSALGVRRSVAPTHKSTLILTSFISNLVIQFTVECLAFMYMIFILGINFGDKYPAILLLLLIGSSLGLSMGMFIGSLSKPAGEGIKMGIGISVSMTMSVLADLCANGIQNAIEHTIPLINRINPAALITDSFYALNTFDNYERFTRNMLILVLITALLLTRAIFMIRRNRYASI